MPYAVLAHRGDTDAKLVVEELERRAPAADVELIWADELLLDSRFTHRLGAAGVETEIACAGRPLLDSRELLGVVCRLSHGLPPQFHDALQADRDYAAMEGYALLLSWLASLECPLLNPPAPSGLSGPALSPVEWQARAAESGLRTSRLRLGAPATEEEPRPEPAGGAERRVLVVGERTFGAESETEGSACVRLARRVACPVLGVRFAASPAAEASAFCGAEAAPSLGDEGAAAVAELLTGEAA